MVENLFAVHFEKTAIMTFRKHGPYSRFQHVQTGEEIHQVFPQVESVTFSLPDILSDLAVSSSGIPYCGGERVKLPEIPEFPLPTWMNKGEPLTLAHSSHRYWEKVYSWLTLPLQQIDVDTCAEPFT